MSDHLIGRRALLKATAAMAGGMAFSASFSDSILRAFSIDPVPGSTFEDAEHIVFLMQENRSFDHAYGTLQGVRGFNDPRAIDIPGGRPVWLQANAKGDIFSPFRLDLLTTNMTWYDGLPHNWTDQVDARNHGKHDQWLKVKTPNKHLAHLPLTMGHHTRADIPFYYQLADAFTVCDQHFCATLTGTTPNRMHFWTGTIRNTQTPDAMPHVYNSDTDHIGKMTWSTFPERLTDHGIPWKLYQNELTIDTGQTSEEDEWLSNFGDNPLEYFAQYHPNFAPAHYAYLQQRAAALPGEIVKLESAAAAKPTDKDLAKKVVKAHHVLEQTKKDLVTFSPQEFAKLSEKERTIHHSAFTTNRAHPDYRKLSHEPAKSATGEDYTVTIPKGDILHQFRQDVKTGKLPMVSWLAAPQRFSDHPSAAWFGIWYISEILNILTQNPEIWKKTIFVLNYDENDGYFDHVPPFVAPFAGRPETGACSEGVDSTLETTKRDRESPLGLGYRVPMVVASPWSRGGWVNSQVFDLTSPIRFLETFLERKRGLKITETNISSWRRTICGDMTSIFRPWNGEAIPLPKFLTQQEWVTAINEAYYKPLPDPVQPLTAAEIEEIYRDPKASKRMTQQEPGVRPSCALPYELRVDASLDSTRKNLEITFDVGQRIFGNAAAGCPFQVYAPGKIAAIVQDAGEKKWDEVRDWNYAVAAGKSLRAQWPLEDFEDEKYHLRVYGPNGFYRELAGSANDPKLAITVEPHFSPNGSPSGNLSIRLQNSADAPPCDVTLAPNAYHHPTLSRTLASGSSTQLILPLESSTGWHDFTITAGGHPIFSRRYAGRVETGRPSNTDPLMGGVA